ncbi:MAG: VOC family protein [Pirellulales bacterium]
MHVQPYLYFNGRCEEAIEFYQGKLGAIGVQIMRFKESPVPPQPGMVPPGSDNKVMHAHFSIGDTQIMASDGNCGGNAKFEGVSLTINAESEADADRLFAALSAGGQVQMPLTETFFSPRFGMVADKFGVSWMVIVPRPQP